MKWNDANCAVKQGFICEKINGDIQAKPKDTLLPLVFNDGNGDPCPEGYSTFGSKTSNRQKQKLNSLRIKPFLSSFLNKQRRRNKQMRISVHLQRNCLQRVHY